jgi:hypothetical protein
VLEIAIVVIALQFAGGIAKRQRRVIAGTPTSVHRHVLDIVLVAPGAAGIIASVSQPAPPSVSFRHP